MPDDTFVQFKSIRLGVCKGDGIQMQIVLHLIVIALGPSVVATAWFIWHSSNPHVRN